MQIAMAVALVAFCVGLDTKKLATDKTRKEKLFAGTCFVASLTVLILYSSSVRVYGPTQWLMDVANLLGMVQP